MANQNWSITIVAGSPCTFVPDVYTEDGSTPTSLQAQLGDLVSWNNQTHLEHEIWLADENYNPVSAITDRISVYGSSTGYVPQQQDVSPATTTPPPPDQTIYYICNDHQDEHGTITIVA
jgi:plastocyanin